ncbi:hypothetical protein ACLOJK_024121 [Asimina triloba]
MVILTFGSSSPFILCLPWIQDGFWGEDFWMFKESLLEGEEDTVPISKMVERSAPFAWSSSLFMPLPPDLSLRYAHYF